FFALTLLASLLKENHLDVDAFFEDATYAQVLAKDIGHKLFENIYFKQLDYIQRNLLIAFSTYRKPVSLDAIRAVIADGFTTASSSQVQSALDILLAQHFLQVRGQALYQPHTIVIFYIQNYLDEHDERKQV